MSIEREFLKKLRYATLLENDLRKELEEILAQPEYIEQDAVAWLLSSKGSSYTELRKTEPEGADMYLYQITPLCAPKRKQEWQGLTEDEIVEILDTTHFNEDKFCFLEACINYCCAIQAKLKRKNTALEVGNE
jgi:hypothetical protein